MSDTPLRTQFEIPLFDVGTKGAGFRVDNVVDENDDPELQRSKVDQWQYKSSDVKYQANLFAVVHGTLTPDGPRAVLIVVDFRFFSDPQERRFQNVDITMAFGRADSVLGGPKEPVVVQLAPEGAFVMDESTETQEDTVEAHVSAEGGVSLANLGIGSSFQRKVTKVNKDYATLHGMGWIEVRNTGEWNSAKWHIQENSKLRNGVPPSLRAAVLLSLPDEGKFRAEITTKADIGSWKKMDRKVGATTGLQPVYFDPSFEPPEGQRKDLGPELTDVVKTNLAACQLASIGAAKVSVDCSNTSSTRVAGG